MAPKISLETFRLDYQRGPASLLQSPLFVPYPPVGIVISFPALDMVALQITY